MEMMTNHIFKMRFDGTGCFHWCAGREMSDCLLTRQEATVTMFAGHIVVAVFAEDDNPTLGLRYPVTEGIPL